MKFDKVWFKAHHGAAFIKYFQLNLLAVILSAVIVSVALFCDSFSLIPVGFQYLSYILIGFTCIGTVFLTPIVYASYIKAQECSRNMRIKMIDDKLIVKIMTNKSSKGSEELKHSFTYTVNHIDDIQVSKSYIDIIGDIHLVEKKGEVKEKDVRLLKIPRSFSNEELILNLQ